MAIPFPDIDPVALHLTETIGIRWYALAYLAGILGGWLYACHLADKDPGRRPNRNDIDTILPLAVLGIILGGRLGYVLFYNLGYYLEHPVHALYVWEGGMSFHGGLLGVIVAGVVYARQQGFTPLVLGDLLTAAAPIGIFFGRVANFINGELYGRIATAPWAVSFPQGGGFPRHPSQLYEALLEGALLFAVLFYAAKDDDIRRAPGYLFGLFLTGYGLARFVVEFYREPDVQIGFIFDYLSLGQILCLPMIAAGAYLIRHARARA